MHTNNWVAGLAGGVVLVTVAIILFWPRCQTFFFRGVTARDHTCHNYPGPAIIVLLFGLVLTSAALRGIPTRDR